MVNITMTTGWNFSTGPDEAALILAALGGRLKPQDIAAAKHLGNTLTLLRARQAKQLATQMAQHAAKVDETSKQFDDYMRAQVGDTVRGNAGTPNDPIWVVGTFKKLSSAGTVELSVDGVSRFVHANSITIVYREAM